MKVANKEQQLQSLLATLEECRTLLVDRTDTEAAHLLSLAILELQMELHKVTDSELAALCDKVASSSRTKPRQAGQTQPFLRLVK